MHRQLMEIAVHEANVGPPRTTYAVAQYQYSSRSLIVGVVGDWRENKAGFRFLAASTAGTPWAPGKSQYRAPVSETKEQAH